MRFVIVKNGIVENIIEATEEVAQEFGAKPWHSGCRIGDMYVEPSEPTPTPHIYTDLEKAQQEITDRELDIIEQGQQVTDLELLSITQNQVINVMTGGNINDNL